MTGIMHSVWDLILKVRQTVHGYAPGKLTLLVILLDVFVLLITFSLPYISKLYLVCIC